MEMVIILFKIVEPRNYFGYNFGIRGKISKDGLGPEPARGLSLQIIKLTT